MDPVDCGERSVVSLASLPKLRRALSVWMFHFDRAKNTPLGPVHASIELTDGMFAALYLRLSIDGITESTSWPVDYERKFRGAHLAKLVLETAESCRMRVSYRLATERGFV